MRRMEKNECWETFLMSGKVTDYLKYRQSDQNNLQSETENRGYAGMHSDSAESDNRVKHNAGFY